MSTAQNQPVPCLLLPASCTALGPGGAGSRGNAAVGSALLPAPCCLSCGCVWLRGRTNVERFLREGLGAGHQATGCHAGDAAAGWHLGITRMKKLLGCQHPHGFLWVVRRSWVSPKPNTLSLHLLLSPDALRCLHPMLQPFSIHRPQLPSARERGGEHQREGSFASWGQDRQGQEGTDRNGTSRGGSQGAGGDPLLLFCQTGHALSQGELSSGSGWGKSP